MNNFKIYFELLISEGRAKAASVSASKTEDEPKDVECGYMSNRMATYRGVITAKNTEEAYREATKMQSEAVNNFNDEIPNLRY